MGFAVRKDGQGWRAVDRGEDCLPDEVYQRDAPPQATIDPRVKLRADRDARLSRAVSVLDRHRNQSDFGLPVTLTQEQVTVWAIYAQVLRDLPENTDDPANPAWPEVPQ